MDLLIGIVFWGGVLVATVLWVSRGVRPEGVQLPVGAPRSPAAGPSVSSERAPPPGRVVSPAGEVPVADARRQEHESLTDGLIIGHLLTRDHYRPHVARPEQRLDEAASRREASWNGGDDADDSWPHEGKFLDATPVWDGGGLDDDTFDDGVTSEGFDPFVGFGPLVGIEAFGDWWDDLDDGDV